MSKKSKSALVAALIIFALSALPALAEVFTEKTGGGRADSVFVAGNPDSYPIEYFDAKSGTYKGLIPDMLSEVSQKTGINFTYISSGSQNRQKGLYKNNQVELVTAIKESSRAFGDIEKIPVLTAYAGGTQKVYCIGISRVLSPEIRGSIISALSEISDPQKSGWLIDTAKNDLASDMRRLATVLALSAAAVLLIIAAVIAIILKKRKEKSKINRMIDESTGIGNKDYYLYAFSDLISEQSKNLYSIAYISFDADSFQEKKAGISADDIEKYAATKLSLCLSDAEYLSFIGKGTFLLLFQAENEAAADARMDELIHSLNKYIADYANVGELFFGGYWRLCENIGTDAETAVYNAKQGYLYAASKKLPYHIGQKAQIAANKKAKKLAEQIDTALENGEFKIYMQFFFNAKTNSFCGAEVLSRWQNREFGLLRPIEYIDILTKTGKIVEHDYKIFEEVCKILEKWCEPPFDKLFLSCNFTRLSVSNPEFSRRLSEISEKYRFSRSRLVVEITESSLSISPEIVSENIKQLSRLGFKVAIDDMGTGFSSLADIYDNEIDIVKIDREFISTCVTERRRKMLGNIILLVHNAGARVICEGVETAQQLEMLQAIDCDITQGFYSSRVLPFSECEGFFRASLKN